MLRLRTKTPILYGLILAFVAGNAVWAASRNLPPCRQTTIAPPTAVGRTVVQRVCYRLPQVIPFRCRFRSEWRQWPSPRCLTEKPGACYRGSGESTSPSAPANCDPQWLTSYECAVSKAERHHKMLLVYFCDGQANDTSCRFKSDTLDAPAVRERLRDYVCVQVPLNEKIVVRGEAVTVLEHEAFREMQGRPGIAIVDYRSQEEKLRGTVVSAFPITETLWYSPEQMSVILNLPPGTLTQRTLIYAVRTHPERPASTESEPLPTLLEEARSHAEYQANTHRQGHQFWDSRFQRIISRLPGGLSAREVCAESWPHQGIVEAAIECVRCWRTSSGHWSAVRSPNRFFGYDMKRGSNGVWYATGIVSQE